MAMIMAAGAGRFLAWKEQKLEHRRFLGKDDCSISLVYLCLTPLATHADDGAPRSERLLGRALGST